MNEELIVIKQLPVIEEHLVKLAQDIDQKVAAALSMVCTEETVKDVKKVRAELTKQYTDLEDQRKAVKAAVLGPYDHFQKIYDECVGAKFKKADADLKGKISGVEDELLSRKAVEAHRYYDELAATLNIDFVPFDRAGIKFTNSSTMKSIYGDCEIFLYGIVDGMKLIDTQEYKDEILVEFRHSLNAAQAVALVIERHRMIQEEAERTAKRDALEAEARRHAAEVKAAMPVGSPPSPLPAPVIEQAPVKDPVYKMSFTVFSTKDKLIALKKFMNDGGYRYE